MVKELPPLPVELAETFVERLPDELDFWKLYFVPWELLLLLLLLLPDDDDDEVDDEEEDDDDNDLFVGNGGAAGNGRAEEDEDDFLDAGPLFTPGLSPVCFFGELFPTSIGLLLTVLARLKLPPMVVPPSLVLVLLIVSLIPS